MPYKTIILELLQQNTTLYQRLRQCRSLLSVVDSCALALKTRHQALKAEIATTRPEMGASQIAAAAMEIAVHEIESRLKTAFPVDEREALSLDEVIAFISNPTSQG